MRRAQNLGLSWLVLVPLGVGAVSLSMGRTCPGGVPDERELVLQIITHCESLDLRGALAASKLPVDRWVEPCDIGLERCESYRTHRGQFVQLRRRADGVYEARAAGADHRYGTYDDVRQ